MKTTQLFTLLVALVMCFPNAYAQDVKNDLDEPKIDIKVQKDTDENGNITRMDSSYAWSWSGCGDLDSIMTTFGDQFDMDFNFPTNFSFNFQMPDIDMRNFRFNFGDSTMAFEDLDEMMEDHFKQWGGEEAFRKHFEEKFDHEELEKQIESFIGSKAIQENMEQFMEKQQEFMEKHQELIEKFQEQEFNRQEEGERIQKNRYQHSENNGTKAI